MLYDNDDEYPEYDVLVIFRQWLARNEEGQSISFTDTAKLDEYHVALRLRSGHWQVWEVDEEKRPDSEYPIFPDFIEREELVRFFEWTKAAIKDAQDKAFKEGRRYGQEQMQKAIRSLIGAADLVELNTDYDR